MTISLTKNYSPSILQKGLFLGQIFFAKILFDKKTYILIFVSILPLLPVFSLKTATIDNYLRLIVISQDTNIFSFAILPLICLILGISAIADEKENKTISQLLSRPVKREEIVLLKWVSVVVIGVVIVCLDALIINIGLCLIVQDFTILFLHLDVLFGVWLFLGMWVCVYGTIFLFLGIIIDKNALGWGLAVAYFEAFFGQFIFGVAAGNNPYSISNHLYHVASEFFLVNHFTFRIPDFEPFNSLLICVGLIIGFLAFSMLVMRRKDFP
jgi:ABC-type transport system involved in multi-copper enzyme maturation permease subunit